MMVQKHTRLFRQKGSPPATFTYTTVPVVMLTLSLRSFASITTGYSNGRPSGVYLAHSCLHTGYPDGRPPGVYLAHSCLHTGYPDDCPPGVYLAQSCLHTGYPDGRPSGVLPRY